MRRSVARKVQPDVKSLAKRLEGVGRLTGYRLTEVFNDWVAACAYAISNTVDLRNQESREQDYMRLVDKYGKEAMLAFSECLGDLTLLLDDQVTDVLGQTYMALEGYNANLGQFFTPFEVSRVMARITAPEDDLKTAMARRGYVTVSEPSCGSGGMLLAFTETVKEIGFNPQTHVFAEGRDLDLTAVHMAYVQLSLAGIPARIIHGNTLTNDIFSVWYTPFYVLHGWGSRLSREPVKRPRRRTRHGK